MVYSEFAVDVSLREIPKALWRQLAQVVAGALALIKLTVI